MSLPRNHFPFDGSCVCSKDADLTLHFDDGTLLKAHSFLLRAVSKVLATAVEELRHEGEISMEGDDKLSWTLLLNILHPCAPCYFHNQMDSEFIFRTRGVLQLATKYSIHCLRESIEEAIVQQIHTKTENAYYHTPLVVVNPWFGDRDMDLFSLMVFAAQYELEKVFEAGTLYLSAFFEGAVKQQILMENTEPDTVGRQLADLIERLHKEGCGSIGKALSLSVIAGIKVSNNNIRY